MAQRLLHRLLLTIFFDSPNGTATVTQTSFGNFFWQSQWHSDCYTDFFWQFLLTIPMAQRLLHRLLLAICGAQILLSSVWQRPPQRPNMATETRFDEEDLCRKFSCYSVTAFFLLSFQVQKLGMQMKAQKQQSTAHNSKNDRWTIAEYDKSHQNIAGTQGKYENNKECEHKCKTTKVLRTKRKCYMDYCRRRIKFSKNCGNTGWLRRHKECKWKLKNNKVLRTTANMIHELLSNVIKAIKIIKILQGHKVTTKKQRMQKKMQKQQSTAHNSKHDTWTLVECDKSHQNHQNIAGTQGNYEKTKNAEENAKATKYCAQQQTWYMNSCRIW